MKMRKLGKGDSDLTKKLDKEAEKEETAQARKFDRILMMQNMTEWIKPQTNLTKEIKV